MTLRWNKITEERYDEMLGVVPPALYHLRGFLMGEPYDQKWVGKDRWANTYYAFMRVEKDFYECAEKLTKAEFAALTLTDILKGIES